MAKVIQEISVEVAKPNYFPNPIAKQCDCNSRFLKVTFVDEGVPITIENGAEVYINANRIDGKSGSYGGEVNDDGTVTVPLHSEMLELAGDVICDITIKNGKEKLTSTRFVVDVERVAAQEV